MCSVSNMLCCQVFWFGPIMGGAAAGLIYEFIFNPRRHGSPSKDSIDGGNNFELTLV